MSHSRTKFKLADVSDYKRLHNYGYSIRESEEKRHKSIKKASNRNGYLWVIRRLSAIRTVLKKKEPTLSRRVKLDIIYTQGVYRRLRKF